MREDLQHILERANEIKPKKLRKKFYKNVTVEKIDSGYAILLDGKIAKTPSKKNLALPNIELAKQVAKEWQEQEKFIDPSKMALTRLVNSAIEGGSGACSALRAEIIKYAGSDLLLYRAKSPKELAQLQEEKWDRVLIALAQKFDVKFMPTFGIIHQEQPKKTLKILDNSLENLDNFTLCALMAITSLTGSALLAIAIYNSLIDADEAWEAAMIDENYNSSVWGEDLEEKERRQYKYQEFRAAIKLVNLLNQ